MFNSKKHFDIIIKEKICLIVSIPDIIDSIINDDELTSYLNLTLRIYFEEFGVYDNNKQKFLELDHRDAYQYSIYTVNKKVHQLDLTVFFKCGEDKSCSRIKELFEIYNGFYGEYFVIRPKYKINHFGYPCPKTGSSYLS